jgi:hypothetical protein
MIALGLKTWCLRWFAGGFTAGLIVAVVMPDHWQNLAFMPWYATWFVIPCWALFLAIAMPLRIDFISDAANVYLLNAIWIPVMGVVFGTYSLALGLIVRWRQGRKKTSRE